MGAFNTILHPTDFSPAAENAYRHATALAKAFGARLHLVHGYETPRLKAYYTGSLSLKLEQAALENLEANLHTQMQDLLAAEHAQGVEVTYELIYDKPIWKVHQYTSTSADLLVMGSQGQNEGLTGVLFGNTAQRMIRFSPVPVFAVPSSIAPKPWATIVFATDFNDLAHINVQPVMDLASAFGATVHVLTVVQHHSETLREKLQADFAKFDALYPEVPFQQVIEDNKTVVEGVNECAKKLSADVVALQTEGRKGFLAYLFGSVTEDVATQVELPLLAIK